MKAVLFKEDAPLLCELPPPVPGPGEAVIAVDACGLCGTDVMKLATRARGSVLGHELAGRISALGADVKGFAEGDRVVVAHHVPCLDCHYCRKGSFSMCRQFKETNIDPGGFSEFVRVPALHVARTMLKVPGTLDAEAASQTEPLACCLRNAKRIGAAPGDTIGIVGLGAIGQMMGRLLSARFGAQVIGLDLDPGRAAVLSSFGQGLSDAESFAAAAREASSGRGLDTLILTAGTPKTAEQALGWLRDGGILNVFASFHPDPRMTLELNAVYHRELSIVSSYSPSLEDLGEALELIAGGLPVGFPTQQVYGLSQFGEAVDAVKSRRVMKAILSPKAL